MKLSNKYKIIISSLFIVLILIAVVSAVLIKKSSTDTRSKASIGQLPCNITVAGYTQTNNNAVNIPPNTDIDVKINVTAPGNDFNAIDMTLDYSLMTYLSGTVATGWTAVGDPPIKNLNSQLSFVGALLNNSSNDKDVLNLKFKTGASGNASLNCSGKIVTTADTQEIPIEGIYPINLGGTVTGTPVTTVDPTMTVTPIPTQVNATPTTANSTPTPSGVIDPNCALTNNGDANGDGCPTMADFIIFRNEYIKARLGTLDLSTAKSNFYRDDETDGVIKINLQDLRVWKDNYLIYLGRTSMTPTPPAVSVTPTIAPLTGTIIMNATGASTNNTLAVTAGTEFKVDVSVNGSGDYNAVTLNIANSNITFVSGVVIDGTGWSPVEGPVLQNGVITFSGGLLGSSATGQKPVIQLTLKAATSGQTTINATGKIVFLDDPIIDGKQQKALNITAPIPLIINAN